MMIRSGKRCTMILLLSLTIPVVASAFDLLMERKMTKCNTTFDCSLNGKCVQEICQCDTPWRGTRCGEIAVGVAKPGGAYGWSPNVTSWGGNPIQDESGQWNLYVAEIPGGLRSWGSHSQCVRATASDVDGPYTRAGTVLAAECHNPSTLRDPVTGEILMFHIGEGPKENGNNHSGFLHYASNPTGPWSAAKTSPQKCNNPAPAYHPNGTLFVICNHLDITYAANDWEGEWAPLRSMGHPGPEARSGNWEDPYLWFDVHGNFHVLYHVYCLDPFEAHNECASGHAFSADGFSWHFGSDEPYSGRVNFTDGTSVVFSTRERPHLVFSDAARHTPMGVFTAVSNQPISPACATCNSHACSQCKVTPGRDWTFTQFQPFANFHH